LWKIVRCSAAAIILVGLADLLVIATIDLMSDGLQALEQPLPVSLVGGSLEPESPWPSLPA